MKVGLLSDIHGNLPALEAVLADMPPVDQVVCAGDVVGYNPWPAACVDRIKDVATVTVRGNHDRMVESPERYRANQQAYAGLKHARKQLNEQHRAWLRDLPEQATIADGQYLVVHSHPDSEDTYVFPEEFDSLGDAVADYEGIVLGHTHIQHAERATDTLVVNPGSVGQPRDGDARAAYAVLDTETESVDLQRVHYNIDRVRHEIVVEDLPEQAAERLYDGA